jgi:hypothetical protein
MKKEVLYQVVLTILIIFNILLLLILIKSKNEKANFDISLQDCHNSVQNIKDRMNNIMLDLSLIYEFDSEQIDYNTIIYDEDENQLSLNQLIQDSPILVFKYSQLHCDVCIDEQISLLKGAEELINENKIILLTNYSSKNDLARFKRVNQLNFKVFNLKNSELTEIDKSFPYYFILDKSFSLKKFFIPIKGDTLLTKDYYKSIKKLFNKN